MLMFDDPADAGKMTLATPEDTKTFSQRFREASALSVDPSPLYGEMDRQKALQDRVFNAAWDQQKFISNMTGKEALMEESIDKIREAVKRASGVEMGNPFRGGYAPEAELELKTQYGASWKRELEKNPGLRLNHQISEFERSLSEYAGGNPAVADAIAVAKIDFAPAMIARRVNTEMDSAFADAGGGIAALASAIGGGFVPSLRDPVNLAGMFIGGAGSKAPSVAMRILEGAGRDALVNAGISAAQQPFVQANRADLGLSAGTGEALHDIGMAAAFGGIFGAGLSSLGELGARIKGGRATPSDVEAALKAAKVDLPPEHRAMLDQAKASEEADRIVSRQIPKDVPPEIADDVLRQAVGFVEDPHLNPPPDLALVLPKAREDRAALVGERLPALGGDSQVVDGKPVTFERFSPSDLTTDAAAMQYKGGSDAAGVTDRLRDVRDWDPLAGGRVFVFERAGGERVIADGHQRLGLARRLDGEGQAGVELVGHLFRQADGWSVQDVRALAAKKNMQEGSGTALDAARVLRDRPDLADGGLPATGPMMRNALSLSRLSDEAFALVNAGVVPEAYGARVGAMVANPLEHDAIMRDLVRFKPESEREASLIIGEAMRGGFAIEHQVDMFGAMETRVSLMGERVKILNDAIKALAQDKRLFGTLSEKSNRIEAAGNVLAGDNASIAQSAAETQAILVKLAQRAGPVSDALTEAARALKEGAKPREAVDQFLGATRTMIDRDGLPALLADPALRPAHVAEPGTPQALAAADAVELRDPYTMDMFGEAPKVEAGAPAPKLEISDMVPLPSRDDPSGTRFVSREEALAEADQLGFAAEIVKLCKS